MVVRRQSEIYKNLFVNRFGNPYRRCVEYVSRRTRDPYDGAGDAFARVARFPARLVATLAQIVLVLMEYEAPTHYVSFGPPQLDDGIVQHRVDMASCIRLQIA